MENLITDQITTPKGNTVIFNDTDMTAKAITPKGKKIFWVRFRTAERRLEYVMEFVNNEKKQIAYKIEQELKAIAAKQEIRNTIQIGTIVHTCWGYDQTNVDYYQVVRMAKSRIYVREIGRNFEGTEWMCGKSTPKKDDFVSAKEEILTVTKWGSLRVGRHYASVDDGTPNYESHYA